MSQRITVKSIVTKPTKKEGTNITTIEDEKGAKMSAFNDTALAQLHAGDILEVDLAVEGKYTNITAWKLIESKPAPVSPVVPAPIITTKEDWAEKDRITRLSIEAQVAAKILSELIVAGRLTTDSTSGIALLGWALTRLSATTPTAVKDVLFPPKAVKEALFPPETSKTTTPPSSQPPAAQTGAVPAKHPARSAALPDSVASVDAAQKIAEQCGMDRDSFTGSLGSSGLTLKSPPDKVWEVIKPLLAA